MVTQEITITTRSRRLGVGCNFQAVQGAHGLYNPVPTAPDTTGSISQVEAAIDGYNRISSGGAFSARALFVGNRRIRAVWSYGVLKTDEEKLAKLLASDAPYDPLDRDECETYGYGWFRLGIGDTLRLLREEREIRVLVEDPTDA